MQRRTIISFSMLAAAAIFGIYFFGCGTAPQMGADADVFREVDALFTAVTARDEKLLSACAQRLQNLKEAGKLPRDASAYLDDVIATARQGRWQPAAERLYRFMHEQRREPAHK